MKRRRKFFLVLLALALLCPLGLVLPNFFQSGGAWGEWGLEELNSLVGFVPEGMEKNTELWSAPLPDYSISSVNPYFSYLFSAVLGSLICLLLTLLFMKAIKGSKNFKNAKHW